jgi:hypothetical protein
METPPRQTPRNQGEAGRRGGLGDTRTPRTQRERKERKGAMEEPPPTTLGHHRQAGPRERREGEGAMEISGHPGYIERQGGAMETLPPQCGTTR